MTIIESSSIVVAPLCWIFEYIVTGSHSQLIAIERHKSFISELFCACVLCVAELWCRIRIIMFIQSTWCRCIQIRNYCPTVVGTHSKKANIHLHYSRDIMKYFPDTNIHFVALSTPTCPVQLCNVKINKRKTNKTTKEEKKTRDELQLKQNEMNALRER